MRTAKTVTLLALFLFLFSIAAVAAPNPHPLLGEITQDGYPVSNVELKIQNLRTTAEITLFTETQGRYQIEMNDWDPYYKTTDKFGSGDVVKVTLVYCNRVATCSGSKILEGGHTRIDFDLNQVAEKASEPLPLLPETVTVIKYVCWDGVGVDDSSKCSVPVVCWDGTKVYSQSECSLEPAKPQLIECADGTVVTDKSECPEGSNTWILWVIGILLLLFGGAGGWKFYNLKFKHYHKGMVGYHDPNTRHSNAKYRHTPFNENPLRCISDVKKIQLGIDLSK